MRTVYTDRYGVQLYAYALMAVLFGHRASTDQRVWLVAVSAFGAVFAAVMFIREVMRRRAARRAGLDPSIVRIVDRASN